MFTERRQGSLDGEETAAPPAVQAHAGGAAALQRSPFYDDLLLSAGAWTWAIWREGATGPPLLQSPAALEQYTAATWSPTRPGVASESCLTQLTSYPSRLQVDAFAIHLRPKGPTLAPAAVAGCCHEAFGCGREPRMPHK